MSVIFLGILGGIGLMALGWWVFVTYGKALEKNGKEEAK